MEKWGPILDFLAVLLPTLLGIVGVFVAIETPRLESHLSRWGWRIGLIIFGIVVSVVTWQQQQVAGMRAASETAQQIKLAQNQLELNYVPSGYLLFQDNKLVFYSTTKTSLYLWGTKLADAPPQIEDDPRIISPYGSYYMFADNFTQTLSNVLSDNSETFVPFELFFTNDQGIKYTAKFKLLVRRKSENIDVNTQMIAFGRSNW